MHWTKTFDVSQSQYKLKPLENEVCDVNKTETYVLVSVTVKVMLCERPSNIGSKRKQNVILSDHTGSCCVQFTGVPRVHLVNLCANAVGLAQAATAHLPTQLKVRLHLVGTHQSHSNHHDSFLLLVYLLKICSALSVIALLTVQL